MLDELTQLVINGRRHTPQLLFFYSSSCSLCNAISPAVNQVHQDGNMLVSKICADDDNKWAPEMLQYTVEKVPCLVLLNKQGDAVARSGEPLSKDRMLVSLEALQRLGQQLPF